MPTLVYIFTYAFLCLSYAYRHTCLLIYKHILYTHTLYCIHLHTLYCIHLPIPYICIGDYPGTRKRDSERPVEVGYRCL